MGYYLVLAFWSRPSYVGNEEVEATRLPFRNFGKRATRSLQFPSPRQMNTYVAIMWIVLVIVRPAIAVISCVMINSTLPLANDTINASCTSVALVNVVAEGNMTINISLAAMVQANPTAANVTVTNDKCFFA